MAGNNKQTLLIRLFPDIELFRKFISKLKIRMTLKYALGDDAVSAGETGSIDSVLEVCRSRWPKAFSDQNIEIDQIFTKLPEYCIYNDEQKERTRKDMLFCYFAYGFTPTEYFVFRLEHKSDMERKEFISSRLRMVFRCKMNNILQADLFNDKAKTYEFFKPYYHRDAISISRQRDLLLFRRFVEKHPVFVKKAVYEAQGNGVSLVDSQSCGMTVEMLFQSIVNSGRHILEERLIQTTELSAFNESSVNTIRAITFNTKHGIRVPYCTIRTGKPGAFVDNGGAGGIQACIDFQTGRIITDGFDESGNEYVSHPSSGTVFKGYQLPDWKQLQSLLKNIALKVPLIRFIGWDLAHTKDGWTIVEGNENCYIIAQQMIRDKGMKREFEKLMDDMDLFA